MIYSITGKISMHDENTLIVDTGSMAFEVTCSSYTVFSLCGSNEPQTLLTYLQVKEDGMCLFGFKDKKEKNLFEDLLLVSGVGPKMAISVLSGLPVDDIVRAIMDSDVKTLSSIKGLGKKTTERIVLELNGKLGGIAALENLVSSDASAGSSGLLKKEIEEASEVLISTGLSKSEAIRIAKENYEDGMTSEQLTLRCFKNLR